MKIIHVIESLAGAGGGLPAAVKSLAVLQESMGYTVGFAATAMKADASASDTGMVRHLKGAGFFASLGRKLAFFRAILAHEYDFVHVHGLWNLSFIAICLCCKLSGTKYVVTTHGQLLSTILRADSFAKRLKKQLYQSIVGKAILRSAYKVHVSSENERLEFLRNPWLAKKVNLIPHIIDPIFFSWRDNDAGAGAGAGAGKFKDILFVGRLDPRKGVLDLIEGFAQSRLAPEWRLRLVGPSSDVAFMDAISNAIAAAGVRDRVLVESPVYGDLRPALYASCYVFCLPSYSEAPGLVNIEAALLARPVVTTPYTGLFDIADSGGVLCGTGAGAISAALNQVANWSPAEYQARSQRIRQWAESMHSLDALVPSWRAFYSE
ncbi:glycosyltransferase [Massilia sp. R2A-15]|uniref:glycosyltransferase n=1 Tax=Massilia sp. R2A-15 TaxID=3064278 RepID=UPI002734131B|nr:glycosyltransferase [Massilia sp. R2A-15]WLI88043.1 glycosyltransferase [Massilia sp. R2A-15]